MPAFVIGDCEKLLSTVIIFTPGILYVEYSKNPVVRANWNTSTATTELVLNHQEKGAGWTGAMLGLKTLQK